MIPLLLAVLAFLGTLFGEPQTAEQRFVAAARKQREAALANFPELARVADERRRRMAAEGAAAQPREEHARKAQQDNQLPAAGAAVAAPRIVEQRFVQAARKQRAEDLANLPELIRIGDEQRRKWAEERAGNLAREQAAWHAQQDVRSQQIAFSFPPLGSGYGAISDLTGRPKTVFVHDYYRQDGTHVHSHYRSPPRRR
jgi:hypothetical protein